MPIIITKDVCYCTDGIRTDFTLTENEQKAIDIIKNIFIDNNLDFSAVQLQKRTNKYISLGLKNTNDFCRLKIGVRSMWFSLDMWVCPEEIKLDPRLSNVEKKNIRHWVIKINKIEEIKKYSDIIAEVCINALSYL